MGLVLVALYVATLGLIGSFAVTMLRHRRKSIEEVLGVWQQGLRRQLGPLLVYGIIGFLLVSWIANR